MKKSVSMMLLCLIFTQGFASDVEIDVDDLADLPNAGQEMPLALPLDGTNAHAQALKQFAITHMGNEMNGIDQNIFRNYLKRIKMVNPKKYAQTRTLLHQMQPEDSVRQTRAISSDGGAANSGSAPMNTVSAQAQQELLTLIGQALHVDNTDKATTISNQSNALTRNHATLIGSIGATALSIGVLVLQAYLTSKSCP